MYVKIHISQNAKVVTICDECLIGKKFEEKDLQLNVSEKFYKGEKKSEKEVVEILKQEDNINIVGEKSINLALKSNIISKDCIKKIKNIPFANIFAF
jgi:hypothetical protein